MKYKLMRPASEGIDKSLQVFYNRGLHNPIEIEFFKSVRFDMLHNYTKLLHIGYGCNMLLKHIEQKSKILIVVDSDTDGYTSSAIMGNFLYDNFEIKADYQIHNSKFHGLEEEKYEGQYSQYNLIIIPDAGSNQKELIYKVQNKYKNDILIIDHHEVEEDYTNDNVVIINPQISEEYYNKSISGAGVVLQTLRYLQNATLKEKVLTKPASEYLDLAMLGNSADSMDVRSPETKAIIQAGLHFIKENSNSFIKKNNYFLQNLIEKNSFFLKPPYSSYKIAYFIAPSINAVTRVGLLEEREVVFYAFLSENYGKLIPSTKRGHKIGDQESYIEQATRVCTNVRNRQKKIKDQNFPLLKAKVTEDTLKSNQILFFESNMDKNLNGLVANQLMNAFNRPVMVLNKVIENGKIFYMGSARSPRDSDEMPDFKQYIINSELAEFAQGHAAAFGLKISSENLDQFLSNANETLVFPKSTPYIVDFILQDGDLTGRDIQSFSELEKYEGEGFPSVKIAIENIKLTDNNFTIMSPDSKPTLKLLLQNGVEAICFGLSEDQVEELYESKDLTLTLVGTPKLHEYNGNITPQIVITKYEIDGKGEE